MAVIAYDVRGFGTSPTGAADGTVRQMADDLRYPALGVKRIQGTSKIWEACASRFLRITFESEGEDLILRNVGPRDATLRKP